MKLWQKVLLGVWITGLLFAGYGLITNEDKAIYRLKDWTPDTRYRVLEIHPPNAQVPQTGRLGAFYSCLALFPGGISRGISTPITDGNERFLMRIGDDVKMHLEVNSIEAYRFKFTIFDNKGKVITGTNIYAINCDIRLLDKPDSDMHCEDRLLSNHVRPVCTYRPEQNNNTNNEQ